MKRASKPLKKRAASWARHLKRMYGRRVDFIPFDNIDLFEKRTGKKPEPLLHKAVAEGKSFYVQPRDVKSSIPPHELGHVLAFRYGKEWMREGRDVNALLGCVSELEYLKRFRQREYRKSVAWKTTLEPRWFLGHFFGDDQKLAIRIMKSFPTQKKRNVIIRMLLESQCQNLWEAEEFLKKHGLK